MRLVGTAERLASRISSQTSDDGHAVIFQRLAVDPSNFLYVAIDWDSRSIIGTSFANTDQKARRALLEDFERRGRQFG